MWKGQVPQRVWDWAKFLHLDVRQTYWWDKYIEAIWTEVVHSLLIPQEAKRLEAVQEKLLSDAVSSRNKQPLHFSRNLMKDVQRDYLRKLLKSGWIKGESYEKLVNLFFGEDRVDNDWHKVLWLIDEEEKDIDDDRPWK